MLKYNSNEICILTCTDSKFLPYSCCSLLTVKINSKSDCLYILIGINLNSNDLIFLNNFNNTFNINILYIEFPYCLKTEPVISKYGAFCCRLYIHKINHLIDLKIKKIIYIDSDMICNKDITHLFNINMNNNVIAAVPDLISGSSKNLKRLNIIGVSKNDYFNSGFMIIDCEHNNFSEIMSNAIEVLDKNNFKYADQDALNYIIKGRFTKLPFRYNLMTPLQLFVFKKANIVHFSGSGMGRKPWENNFHFINYKYRLIYENTINKLPNSKIYIQKIIFWKLIKSELNFFTGLIRNLFSIFTYFYNNKF